MILGIGTDIIEIERVQKAIKSQRFLQKVFTTTEIEFFKNNKFSLSGNFASKEAIVKAFGTGFSTISPKEIEILRNDKGKPFVNLYGKALNIANNIDLDKIHISISHNNSNAIAYVILEKYI